MLRHMISQYNDQFRVSYVNCPCCVSYKWTSRNDEENEQPDGVGPPEEVLCLPLDLVGVVVG